MSIMPYKTIQYGREKNKGDSAMDQRGQQDYYEDEFEQAQRRSSLLTGVFLWMLVGLLVSALMAVATMTVPVLFNFVLMNGYGFFVIIIVELVLVAAVFPRVWKMSAGAGFGLFLLYSALNGMMLSVIFLQYSLGTIYLAFFSAAAMFGIMALYGAVTKTDLSSKGSFLIMGLAGVIMATLLNFLFQSTMLDAIITYAAIAIFLGLTAYDVNRIKQAAAEVTDSGAYRGVMILGALTLYLDFINLFLRVLRLLGRRR